MNNNRNKAGVTILILLLAIIGLAYFFKLIVLDASKSSGDSVPEPYRSQTIQNRNAAFAGVEQ